MSDPTNQRADGCSVFFTFLVFVLLLCGFYFAQAFFEPESPAPVTDAVDTARKAKAQAFREQDTLFISKVDQVHSDANTTLESSMREVLKNYRASFRANQKQPQ